jgi:hypothetical protein
VPLSLFALSNETMELLLVPAKIGFCSRLGFQANRLVCGGFGFCLLASKIQRERRVSHPVQGQKRGFCRARGVFRLELEAFA